MRTYNTGFRSGLLLAQVSALALMAADDAVSSMDSEGSDFSLADLADIDVTEIAEIRFENLPPGTYEFEVTKAQLLENEDKDGISRFLAEFTFKVLECRAVLQSGVDKESLVGKSHTEKLYIRKDKTQEEILAAIGRLRAFVTDLGCVSTGKLGDMVENTVGHTFRAKITEKADPNDKTIKYARLKLEPPKKAA